MSCWIQMDWRIPEGLKKRVSQAQFAFILSQTCDRVSTILDNSENYYWSVECQSSKLRSLRCGQSDVNCPFAKQRLWLFCIGCLSLWIDLKIIHNIGDAFGTARDLFGDALVIFRRYLTR